MVVNNGSFNCNSAKLLITHKEWDKRQALVDRIELGLKKGTVRKAYYPGAEDRWKQFTDGRKAVRLVGNAGAGELPYALIPDVDPNKADDRVFHQEPWCTVLSETGLTAANPLEYLKAAVSFVNQKLWGTLCCTFVVHPKTLKDPAFAEAFEAAIRSLEYGTVAINTWPATVFALGTTPWGGHPSSDLKDIQSGIGWVHNTLMIDGIEKVVMRAPVKGFPISPWFPGHRTCHILGKRLVDFEFDPSWLKVPAVAAAGLRA
jgi:aldehyde dehydrogenase (NAD(P)+)